MTLYVVCGVCRSPVRVLVSRDVYGSFTIKTNIQGAQRNDDVKENATRVKTAA